MWLDPMQLGVGSGFLFLRIRSQIEVVYAVAAGDAFSRPNSSATACSTTVPLEEARIVARVQHGGIGERELAKILFGDETLFDHLEASGITSAMSGTAKCVKFAAGKA
jgi:hypothetical protein